VGLLVQVTYLEIDQKTQLAENPSAENVRLRVGPYQRTTLITSNLTVVSGGFSCNTTTPKAYVFTTTTRIGIKRDPEKRPRELAPPLIADSSSSGSAKLERS
jgi:hypothetical protein